MTWRFSKRNLRPASFTRPDLHRIQDATLTTTPPFTEGDLNTAVALIPLGTEPEDHDPSAYQEAEVEAVNDEKPSTRRLDNGVPFFIKAYS